MSGELIPAASASGVLISALIGQLLYCRDQLDLSGESLAAAHVDQALHGLAKKYSGLEANRSKFELSLNQDFSIMDEMIQKIY